MVTFLSAADAGFSFPVLHPIFVHFTVVLIPLSFFCDALGAWWKREGLRAAGWWTLLAAALITPVTVALGWIWMDSMPDMSHWAMPWHQWIGVGLGIALIPLAAWRGWRHWKGRGPGYVYVLPAAIIVFALLVQGDLGGAMSLGSGIVFKSDSPFISSPATQPSSSSSIQWKDYLVIKE